MIGHGTKDVLESPFPEPLERLPVCLVVTVVTFDEGLPLTGLTRLGS